MKAFRGPFKTVCLTDDREAWLAARNTGIGASEIAVLLGENDWDSPLGMWLKKTGQASNDSESSEPMQWGLLLESAIIAETARRAGVVVRRSKPRLLRSKLHQWALATCDAMTADLEPIEVKAISHGFDAEDWEGTIPRKYFLQCQQQMLVTGAKRCLFGALLWGSRLVWDWIERDEAVIAKIIAAGESFWASVEALDPPESTGHPGTRKLLGQLATVDEPVELFESEIARELQELEAAKLEHAESAESEKQAKRRLAAAQDAIALLLGDRTSGLTASGWSFRWKTTERRGYSVEPATVKQFEIKPPKAEKVKAA